MSRALVALDALRQLTDGTPEDLAALLLEVVNTPTVVGPWKAQPDRSLGALPYARDAIVRAPLAPRFRAIAAPRPTGGWGAVIDGVTIGIHPSREAAMAACDEHLRARGWALL